MIKIMIFNNYAAHGLKKMQATKSIAQKYHDAAHAHIIENLKRRDFEIATLWIYFRNCTNKRVGQIEYKGELDRRCEQVIIDADKAGRKAAGLEE